MTLEQARRLRAAGHDRTDRARLGTQTDEDIRRAITADPDAAPELGGAWFDEARAVADRVAQKRAISLRVDADVLAFFKKQGRGYQSRMHAVLRAYVDRRRTLS